MPRLFRFSRDGWYNEERMVLIRDSSIVDGTGKPSFQADVLLKGDRILAVGSFPRKRAETVIDGPGLTLAPGFIDVNTDSDHYLTLFTDPTQEDFLLQGVTTIIGGNCGSSLAPLLYGSLESIRKWTDTSRVNVNWHTVDELFAALRKRSIGVNFGMLVGHSTIRRALIGEVFRDLTLGELKVFSRILAQALEEGAFGLSSGLGYVHARRTPYAELKFLLETVRALGGIYTTHLRDERGGLLDSLNETIRLAEELGVPTIVSHLRPLLGFEREFESGLLMLGKSETDVRFDCYPFDTSIVPIYTLLPGWVQSGGVAVMQANIGKPHGEDAILRGIPPLEGDELRVLFAPGVEYLVGKTLAEFSENRGLTPARGLLELMRVTNLRAVMLYRNVNVDWAVRAVTHPRAFVASNSPSFGAGVLLEKPERAYRTFPHFLVTVTEGRFLTYEEAIRKVTALPAHMFRLRGRGEIKPGYLADLVLFKGHDVTHVFVNGRHAVENGELKDGRAGVILRRS